MQTENLLFDDISKQVNKVLGENNINDPQNKKGIDIITQDLNQQNEKGVEEKSSHENDDFIFNLKKNMTTQKKLKRKLNKKKKKPR